MHQPMEAAVPNLGRIVLLAKVLIDTWDEV